MQLFVRDDCAMIAAPVQCDVDGIPKGSHFVLTEMARESICRFVSPEESAVAPQKFKSRRQLLPQLATGFEFAEQSGRLDLNQRPHGPEPCALAKLSYAPSFLYRNGVVQIVNRNGGGSF
jgi:hypothetical protein